MSSWPAAAWARRGQGGGEDPARPANTKCIYIYIMLRYKVELYIFVVNIKCNLPAEKKVIYLFIHILKKSIDSVTSIRQAPL